MSKLKIAIIDCGVNKKHPAFVDDNIVLISNKITSSHDTFYGHGNAVYNIIRKVSDIADITNFKIDNIEEGICEEELTDLLEKIYKEYKFDIINLSLGINTCIYLDRLKLVCNHLIESGTVIVCAFDNTGSISYPAAFPNVIGVTSDITCTRISDFVYFDDSIVNIGAKGNIQRVAWNNPDYIMLGGNSFACAHVTVQVAKIMSKGIMEFQEILKEFQKISIKQSIFEGTNKGQHIEQLQYKIHKAILFPFNKEMHSLIRFSSELDFEIVGVYDTKYSANVGSTTNHIMKDNVKSLPINNISTIKWDTFDTIILGHLDEMSELINKQQLKNNIVELAKKYNKNVYSFDDISSLSPLTKNIYYPKITKEDLPPYRMGKLYRYSKPIIGIYGTSSKQGKFTLQLEIRKRFLNLGYRVGQIGTEPSALLYGMDAVYPMGYNNSVYIHHYDSIRYLNNVMQKICEKDVDIIITGSQSGVVPFDTGNLAQFSLPQIDFLMGTQPDVVILCINPYDDIDYISRTKLFIESSVGCKVIGFVMFPMDICDNWKGIYGQLSAIDDYKYNMLCTKLYDTFSLPVFKLGSPKDLDVLVEKIIDCF